ncbi:MAG: methyltransferase domain-containing protein [Synechococcus sp.]
MATKLLSDHQRFKLDREDDRVFYREPRFVHHLDQGFRSHLTQLYRQRIPPCATVLDLGSSWVSHLPDDVSYDRVIGHGMNEAELQANPRLDHHWIQDFNRDQRLPLESGSVDVCLAVAAWQYWTEPEAIAEELRRVTRPGGSIIVAFSNRMFFTKAPQIWTDSSDQEHLDYVESVLAAQGWGPLERVAEVTRAGGIAGLFGAQGDPFFAVIGQHARP